MFRERLLLEGEQEEELDEEERDERQKKYSKRRLGTNADRYKEEEPELDEHGEHYPVRDGCNWMYFIDCRPCALLGKPVLDPEVDISDFLSKQRTSDSKSPFYSSKEDYDDAEDIDYSLPDYSQLVPYIIPSSNRKKGKIEEVEWDEGLEDMIKEKDAEEAKRELKVRFKATKEMLVKRPVVSEDLKQGELESFFHH